jgi:CHAP domain
MKLVQFASNYAGRSVVFPGGIGGQCMDLAEIYNRDCLGRPALGGNAIDQARRRLPGLIWIPNTASNWPQPGDLVIWNMAHAVNVGRYGHIAICLAADSWALITLDQNWPTGADTAVRLHLYTGVAGWQHPTTPPPR